MEWTPGGVSNDIEDRRNESGGDAGGGGFGFGGIHLGCGGIIIVGILSLLFHRNLFTLFSNQQEIAPTVQTQRPDTARDQQEQPEVQLVSFVLDDVQNTWTKVLPDQTKFQYRRAKLVLFRTSFPSACGTARVAIGPFYCPEDEKVYLDLSFFDELRSRFHAPGDFAQAYVIAHELGHHVQKIRGIEQKVRQLQEEHPEEQNPLSVRLELQADCYAGIWAHSTEQRNIVKENDVQEALNAAAAVGDDRLQRMARGHVSPETFTHGSSEQRMHWFKRGLETGQIGACNTFSARSGEAAQ